MDELRLMAMLWAAHVVLALPVVGLIVWVSRKRVAWQWWELVAFVLPFVAWFGLITTSLRPKSLANLGECAYVSVAIVVAAAVRAALGRRGNTRWVGVLLVAGATAASVGAYLVTPPWPE